MISLMAMNWLKKEQKVQVLPDLDVAAARGLIFWTKVFPAEMSTPLFL